MNFVYRLKFLAKYFAFLVAAILILHSCSDSKKETESGKIVKEVNYDRFGFIADSFDVFRGTVKKNETLADILLNSNIDYNLVTEIYNKTKPQFDFKKIQPEKIYKIYSTQDSSNQFKAFVYEIDKVKFLKVTYFDSLKTEIVERDVTVKQNIIGGEINSSLYETFSKLNAPIVLAGSIAEIFAWQIDFYTIQNGDRFFAIYEELYVGNEMVGIGEVIAAKFIHKSNPYYAFEFEQNEKKEFFDEEGKSLQKQFLKAPLKYSRISSHYSGSRLHPIFRVYKPHRGIDYAAAIGTPVQAVGDGIVIKAERDGGAGKMVKIKHNSFYSSAYLHLSGYGKGIKTGKKVSQGQVIGFVGSTGNSTGPHLDFRFWKNGALVNYLNQKFPSSKSVADSNINYYKHFSDSLKNNLDSLVITENYSGT